MFTAKDLLYKALDYDGYWNTSKRMLKSKPSQLRQLQLEKLLKGFDISKTNAKPQMDEIKGNLRIQKVRFISVNSKQMNRSEYLKTLTDFTYFTTGEFIYDRSPEKYQDLIERIIATSKSAYPDQSDITDKEPLNLANLFRDLYNFRHHMYILTKYSYGTKRLKSFSTADDYALYLRKGFIASMETGLLETDEILCDLINPEKRTVREDEINYPSDDLKAIDEEWENEKHS